MASSPLVVHHGAIGDLIQLTAMLQALAARRGGACDVLAGGSPAPTILAGLPFVGEVRRLADSRRRPYWTSPSQRALVRWLRRRGPSPCWVVERWRRPVAPWSERTRLESLLERAGVGAEHWVTTRDRERPPLEHAVDYYQSLARLDPPANPDPTVRVGSGDDAGEPAPAPRLTVSDEERDACRSWLAGLGWDGEPLIAMQTEARRRKTRGRWPAGNWLRLIEEVRARLPEGRILFVGSPRESDKTEALAAAADDPRVTSVAHDLPLRRLFALLTLTHSCVSLDTGPAHAAAALGCPLVVLTGTADPRRNRPLGTAGRVTVLTAWPRDEWTDDPQYWFDHHDMSAIPVADTVAAWESLGSAGSRPGSPDPT